jgi:hypothetical protein
MRARTATNCADPRRCPDVTMIADSGPALLLRNLLHAYLESRYQTLSSTFWLWTGCDDEDEVDGRGTGAKRVGVVDVSAVSCPEPPLCTRHRFL